MNHDCAPRAESSEGGRGGQKQEWEEEALLSLEVGDQPCPEGLLASEHRGEAGRGVGGHLYGNCTPRPLLVVVVGPGLAQGSPGSRGQSTWCTSGPYFPSGLWGDAQEWGSTDLSGGHLYLTVAVPCPQRGCEGLTEAGPSVNAMASPVPLSWEPGQDVVGLSLSSPPASVSPNSLDQAPCGGSNPKDFQLRPQESYLPLSQTFTGLIAPPPNQPLP